MDKYTIVDSNQMYACDDAMIHQYHIPSSVLMENAASSVYQYLAYSFADLEERRLYIFAGPGNNGQDGLVLARQLTVSGCKVFVYCLFREDEASDSFLEKTHILQNLNVPVFWDQLPDKFEVSANDILIDGIFGIGLNRPPEGVFREAIELINEFPAFVISLDIPSGLSDACESESVVNCDCCITFGLPKQILLTKGFNYIDTLFCSDLKAPYLEYTSGHYDQVILNEPISLSARDKLGYKNTFGKLLIVSGSRQYRGAPNFAASAFMRSGGGYLHLITTDEVASSVAVNTPECVLHPFSCTQDGSLPEDCFPVIEELGTLQDLILIGPGLSLTPSTTKILRKTVLSKELLDIPFLIDGDGLTLLAEDLTILTYRLPYSTILTPHYGEMSRLTGRSIDDIINNPVNISREFADKWKVYLVLKAPHSIIVGRDHVYINTTGNDALSTAGTGDVLDGIITALCTSPLGIEDGLRTAVHLHGLLGNWLSELQDNRTVTASRLLEYLPEAITRYQKEYMGKTKRMPAGLRDIRLIYS